MALSNAANLANLASSDALTVDNTNDRVGIASTTPTVTLDVAGIVSATSYYGDGSNLEGVASAGLGTALSDSGDLSVLYYTDERLSIGDTITVTVPDSSNAAYTQYQEIVLESGADLIVSDGNDLIPDILGIASDVQQPGALAGAGGRVRADNYTSKAGGAPTFPSGVVVSSAATFSSNVSIAGTLTYEDVTNVDSIGVITARSGIVATGVVTATSFVGDGSNLTGIQTTGTTGTNKVSFSPTINTNGTVTAHYQTLSDQVHIRIEIELDNGEYLNMTGNDPGTGIARSNIGIPTTFGAFQGLTVGTKITAPVTSYAAVISNSDFDNVVAKTVNGNNVINCPKIDYTSSGANVIIFEVIALLA